jgi:hypothetical protein
METQSHAHEEHGPEVTITINGDPYKIHRGREKVMDIKKAGGVPLADDLVQVVNGKPVRLDDEGSLTIKGGEQFVSHPKGSGSA